MMRRDKDKITPEDIRQIFRVFDKVCSFSLYFYLIQKPFFFKVTKIKKRFCLLLWKISSIQLSQSMTILYQWRWDFENLNRHFRNIDMKFDKNSEERLCSILLYGYYGILFGFALTMPLPSLFFIILFEIITVIQIKNVFCLVAIYSMGVSKKSFKCSKVALMAFFLKNCLMTFLTHL